MKSFSKILIANRGEIACRIIQSAKRMGLRTVVVYSDVDASSLAVSLADESVPIGMAAASESYLNISRILDAAAKSRAEAIHPGYGFLSENPDFAMACEQAGIVFIGPSSDAIGRMGNKGVAKQLAEENCVACIEGYRGSSQDDATFAEAAQRIGYPLMIKAAAGGGGRGMRRVRTETELLAALAGARTEAKNAFGSDELILEKLVENARHVEIQLIADAHGDCVTFGERDCSVQRRHQKVFEESPCPAMTKELRASMSEAARRVALVAGYGNAGTVEFLLDSNGSFYFLEMNTRLQVEHPVTEMVCGLDLVELQIRVARGERIRDLVPEVRLDGHAIEARIYAEDPDEGFRPQTGEILRWKEPSGDGIRVDHGIFTGWRVTPDYDPMLAKVIAYGSDRKEALGRLERALSEMVILGVRVNVSFLRDVLSHEVFRAGEATTGFLESTEHFWNRRPGPGLFEFSVASVALIEHASQRVPRSYRGWRSTGPASVPLRLESGGKRYSLRVAHRGHRYQVHEEEISMILDRVSYSGDTIRWVYDGVREQADCLIDGNQIYLQIGGRVHRFEDLTYAPPADATLGGAGRIVSPMSGRVLNVLVQPGQSVRKGEVLVIVEAMKMENQLSAPRDGVVEKVAVAVGDQVDANQFLVGLSEEDKSG